MDLQFEAEKARMGQKTDFRWTGLDDWFWPMYTDTVSGARPKMY
jgi:hypothetical protein